MSVSQFKGFGDMKRGKITPTELAMGRREWAMLVLLAVIWGSSFFFFKIMLAALPPFTVVFGRVGLSAVILNL